MAVVKTLGELKKEEAKEKVKKKKEKKVSNVWDGRATAVLICDIVKETLNDHIGWSENFSVLDQRILLGLLSLSCSIFAIYYDYVNPFPKSKWVLVAIIALYTIVSAAFQLWEWYVAEDVFYAAKEVREDVVRNWQWSGHAEKFGEVFVLKAEFSDSKGKKGKMMMQHSMCSLFHESGHLDEARIISEVKLIYQKLTGSEL